MWGGAVSRICYRISPFKLFLMCLVTIIISQTTLCVGLQSKSRRYGRVSKFQCSWEGRCGWKSMPVSKTTGVDIAIELDDFLAAILASVLLLAPNKKNPYYYLPWLILTLKGFIFIEGPTLVNMSRIIVPSDNLAAAFFLIGCIILFIEQICLWSDVLTICFGVWKYHIECKGECSM